MITSERNAAAEVAVAKLLAESSGFELSELDQQASFPELGFDSLFLVQFSQKIKSQLKVKITFRQLIEEIPNIQSLISYVSQNLPEDLVAANIAAPQPSESPAPPAPVPQSSAPATSAAATPPPASAVQTPAQTAAQAPPPVPAPQAAPQPAVTSATPAQVFPVMANPRPIPTGSNPTDKAGLAQIISQQNQLMSLQLQLLSGIPQAVPTQNTLPAIAPPAAAPKEPAVMGEAAVADTSPAPAIAAAPKDVAPEQSTPVVPTQSPSPLPEAKKTFERFGPYKPVRHAADGGLTDRQQEHLDALIARFTKRTANSRRHAQEHRSHFADPRGVAGYRRIWKSMVYQIAVEKSKGSKLWDIDGNEYIDIAMGFGLNLFGQSPDFINDAIAAQLKNGVEVGPQSPLAGDVAALLCDFSRKERVTFCNTGSEAVMAAMRLARTVTGKSKIVFFNKDYHGNFDQVLIRSNRIANRRMSQPAAPGVLQAFADQTIVLDYGTDEALQTIRDQADEIAAILVEPVQSADPFTQPTEFLKEIRRITQENQIAMVMDEVITGFRAAPGGAQEWFDVWGDMATYGKVLGGGLPIGALAGSAEYMDALDGGDWKYEDDSEPEADMTFFAGTFVRHPLAMAAAHQVLMKVKESGPGLQRELTDKTTYLVNSLNQFFEDEVFPFRLAQYTSLFRFMFPPTVEYADLLYFHLLDRGIFTRGWGDNCFLSTAHTNEDVQRIIEAVKDSCNEMRRGGFLPDRTEVEDRPASLAATTDGEKKKSFRFELTEAQLEIWITSQMGDEASCSYNEPFTVRFGGQLDSAKLCDAIQTVVARHGSLHIRFADDGKYQEPRFPEPINIEHQDVTGLPADKQEAVLAGLAKHFGSKPFDLSNDPLLRLKLVKLSDDQHVLFFSAHHIVSDGWSTGLVLNEVCEVYTALVENRVAVLPEPGDFADYVAMEAEDDQESQEAVAYWMNQFRELPDPLDLPSDRPRASVKDFAGSTLIHKFDTETYEAIKKTAANHNVTLFTMTLSVLNVLLARLSGQNDIVITIPTAGQVFADNQCLVGHCVNLLPIRSQLEMTSSFDSLLKKTQTLVLDAYDHQQCTLGRIVRELKLPRDASRMPLVEVNFNLDRDGAGLEFPGLTVDVAQTIKTASTFDLFFNLNETDDGLELYLDYSTSLFDEETIRRWVGHYATLLQQISQSPTESIRDLPLLTDAEEQQILVDWNATQTEYPSAEPVYQLFEKQAKATPNAVAVIAGKTSLSYQEINERANQLARHLQNLGVSREQLIGIHLQRSHQMIVSVLGILKAGATYVPLDPSFPIDRLAMMANDAELSVVVTEQSLKCEFAPSATRIDIDRDWTSIQARDRTNLDLDIDTRQLAYVLYTSGSTGKPKGVQIPHQALTNFLCSMQRGPGLERSDTLLNVTTLSFDISALEIYLPLITGARLVVASAEEIVDGARLINRIEKTGVTVMQATPATWRLLIESGWKGKPNLKILCGGEALPPDLANQLIQRGKSVWNMYGPTETTIWSTIKQVESNDQITIGRPIANTEIYILDDRNRPVPQGVVGRLFIGGDGLARGYHLRPDLTAEKFVSHPFRPTVNERIYDTGDQARYLADGEIEFLGRRDHQVKLRGFRIELGEIEQAISQHPDIDQAIVVLRDHATDGTATDQAIVAYMISKTDAPKNADLRDFLRKTLPEYMVPSTFVSLKEFPLTPNRKIDRKALPAPIMDREIVVGSSSAPQDSVELQIANVWKRTLSLQNLGRDDNFFDVGGHSLLAARMIVDLEKLYGHKVPLATLLQAPTVRTFANIIKDRNWQPTWQCLVPIQERGSKPPLFCVHAAGGNVLLYRDLARHLGDDQPVYGLQAKGLDGKQPVLTTVEEMAAEYVAEIRKIQPTGPYNLAGYCLGGTIAYEVAQQLMAANQRVAVLALFDTHSHWFQSSLFARLYGGSQQIAFHAANVWASGPKGVGAFLKEKFFELNRRFGRRFVVANSKLQHAIGRRKDAPLVMLEQVNDQASEEYVPHQYLGKLTVFKPCKAYLGYEDPTLGWGNGLVDDLEIIKLPVFPAGMLIEPFVQELSMHLQRCLDDANGQTKPAMPEPDMVQTRPTEMAV
ncbi:amino acid adenylation domain-containing protein [Neorhodopirellula lusitana]|uniref:Amino acid adenylation domain-containing protein n=1 Tax=Neorhodopirellula lusitana TaxID=445327 RepID=A0ABY1QEL9_9BACT|nr:non-ribosomal peptide synthetase [Neorhodopirellula lusitana]SMP68490.1 amino acid adenylation domain-containing protein [Neorhodopirellula lusitana]